MSDKHIDEVSGISTTGHEWDGIRELDNPMPRWWLWTFYATIVWALGYTIAYPAWPLINKATSGVVGFAIPGNPFRCPPGPYERISMVASYLRKAKPKSKILALDAKDQFSKQSLFQDGWKELYGDMVEWVPLGKDGKVTRVDVESKVFETEFGHKHKVDVGNVIPPQSAAKIAIDAGLVNESGWVPINTRTFEALKAPHIHVIVSGQGLPKLTTQLYNDGEPQNERDHIFRSIAPAARDGVLMKLSPAPQLEAGALLAESRLVMPV